jgi:aryl-alcohol dehydrogenase-like predicted oxidoreductase
MTMAQLALRWILMFDAVSCTIPGARRPSQADENVGAGERAALSEATMQQIRDIYDRRIRPQVHERW